MDPMDRAEYRDSSGSPLADMKQAAEALDERVKEGNAPDQYPWWVAVVGERGLSLGSNMDDPHLWLIKSICATGGKPVIMQTMAYLLSMMPDEGLARVGEAVERMREASGDEDPNLTP